MDSVGIDRRVFSTEDNGSGSTYSWIATVQAPKWDGIVQSGGREQSKSTGGGWHNAIWRVLDALRVSEPAMVMVWVKKGWKASIVSLGRSSFSGNIIVS